MGNKPIISMADVQEAVEAKLEKWNQQNAPDDLMRGSNIPKIRLSISEDKHITEAQFRAFISCLPYTVDIPQGDNEFYICIPANRGLPDRGQPDQGTVLYCISKKSNETDKLSKWQMAAISDQEIADIFIIERR